MKENSKWQAFFRGIVIVELQEEKQKNTHWTGSSSCGPKNENKLISETKKGYENNQEN